MHVKCFLYKLLSLYRTGEIVMLCNIFVSLMLIAESCAVSLRMVACGLPLLDNQ